MLCMMTPRQRVLYRGIKNNLSLKELFLQAESRAKMDNLMNLVMQFRKVCNHPDLFERLGERIPIQIRSPLAMALYMPPNLLVSPIEVRSGAEQTALSFTLPKLVFDELDGLPRRLSRGARKAE